MNGIVDSYKDQAVVSSRDIAGKFGKTHDSVMKAANKVIEEIETDSSKVMSEFFIKSTYETERGKTYKNILLTKDGFCLVAMSFTGQKALSWKLKYIEAFNKMEGYIANESKDFTSQINKLSLHLDEIKDAGSVWGKTGIAIRKKKQKALKELDSLMCEAQLKLGF